MHYNKTDEMISVACHPHLPLVVVGCANGKILAINEIDQPHVTRVVYHWHSLPVTALAFTKDGTHFLSGGHECVLVRWNLHAAADRKYVPRVGAAIRRIAISASNDFYAVSLSDNSVAVFGSTRVAEAVFRGMIKCPFKRAPDDGFANNNSADITNKNHNVDVDVPTAVRLSAVPTGLHLDPRSNCLVLNGRLGHLQFYDLTQDRCLQSLDILNLNFVSPDSLDGGQILAEVKLIAFDGRGEWLVTVCVGRIMEYRLVSIGGMLLCAFSLWMDEATALYERTCSRGLQLYNIVSDGGRGGNLPPFQLDHDKRTD